MRVNKLLNILSYVSLSVMLFTALGCDPKNTTTPTDFTEVDNCNKFNSNAKQCAFAITKAGVHCTPTANNTCIEVPAQSSPSTGKCEEIADIANCVYYACKVDGTCKTDKPGKCANLDGHETECKLYEPDAICKWNAGNNKCEKAVVATTVNYYEWTFDPACLAQGKGGDPLEINIIAIGRNADGSGLYFSTDGSTRGSSKSSLFMLDVSNLATPAVEITSDGATKLGGAAAGKRDINVNGVVKKIIAGPAGTKYVAASYTSVATTNGGVLRTNAAGNAADAVWESTDADLNTDKANGDISDILTVGDKLMVFVNDAAKHGGHEWKGHYRPEQDLDHCWGGHRPHGARL